MIEIRIHGRGGQGTVTAAELIAEAAFFDKKFSQAFPFFGVERRGAPIEAYTRISDQPILLHSEIYEPDFLIIQDPTLLKIKNTFRGIKKNTSILINTEKDISSLPLLPKNIQIKTVPATQIALKILGKPIINTVMLGAFAGAFKLISLESLKKSILERFSQEIALKNIKAMEEAYNS
ncbi:pyruvate ferredoxin oxidoreductase [Candidatus Falkowbacteria bacterium RIFOXYB2_FULL_38_15]|uniref:Pyruvate ferredoxin oxidoreductase n=1 Tax=Candidatus Falkowbacteria bacterium RIFOXYA2_FULL_38_12 TaxID=1797993 RepID=A0A1F5S5I8_9BACT|nr:MAG: pyruvate ferredoxin oxidoreductase [Candidatus Falkowbacteria bacterium RIFOXYA2_FULL_38_12]OGF32827.1 MAG: pyruvate ferredoxin oxidoreductase [Candidatus Falkowbacteria bacterium RIFOXYB2_FULL_38_15]OGF42269.1 MAG: pyruvate ferredoxin oxidoreductase [Candidatus Falkowbacteria bacterium RIFOXYD2_FULL_39_16]